MGSIMRSTTIRALLKKSVPRSFVARFANSFSDIPGGSLASELDSFKKVITGNSKCILSANASLEKVVSWGEYSLASQMFRELYHAGVAPSEHTIAIMAKCYSRLDKLNNVLPLLSTCLIRGLSLNAYVVNSVLDALVSKGRSPEAELFLIKVIEHHSYVPDNLTFNIFLKGKSVDAISVFESLASRGFVFQKPDNVTYGTLIRNLCQDGLLDDAYEVLKKAAVDESVSVDGMIYGPVVKAYLDKGKFTKALELVENMKSALVEVPTSVYNMFIDYFCKKKMLLEAELVLQSIIKSGASPNLHSYNTLLNGYCQSHDLAAARKPFYVMASGRLGVFPDIVAVNTVLNGLCKCGTVDEANAFWREDMIAKGHKPNIISYSMMIQAMFEDKSLLLHLLCIKK